MSDSPIHSSKAPEPVGLYPHARRLGDLSGLVPAFTGEIIS